MIIRRDAQPDLGPGSAPEPPTPFGYKITWYAVRSENSQAVADALGLQDCRPAPWNEGVKTAYDGADAMDGRIYISPPIGSWVLAVGFDPKLDLQTATPPHEYNPLILELSKRFGEAQFFGTHRAVEWHAWARAEKGEMKRAYSYVGDQGEVFLDIGQRTKEELDLGMEFDGKGKIPKEDDVVALAAAWSVDPLLTNINSIPGAGIIGIIK